MFKRNGRDRDMFLEELKVALLNTDKYRDRRDLVGFVDEIKHFEPAVDNRKPIVHVKIGVSKAGYLVLFAPSVDAGIFVNHEVTLWYNKYKKLDGMLIYSDTVKKLVLPNLFNDIIMESETTAKHGMTCAMLAISPSVYVQSLKASLFNIGWKSVLGVMILGLAVYLYRM